MTKANVEVVGGFGELPVVNFAGVAPEGLHIEVLEEGGGAEIKVGDTIEVNYHGVVWDGSVFDSSFLRGSSIEFPIGVGMLIKAWDKGIPGHKVGTRILITATPEFAYGHAGTPDGSIKGTDILTFIVDIINVK